MSTWSTVELSGKSFAIPRVCPNCMAPGDKPWTATHLKDGFPRPTRLKMTFYYCDACDGVFKVKQAIEKKQLSYGPKLLSLWVFVFFGCLMGMLIGMGPDSGLVSGLVGWVVALAAIGGGVQLTRRMGAKRRALMDDGLPPLPPNALGYGFAAYLIDSQGGLFTAKTATFSAARREWIDLLVDANAAAQA